MKIKRILSLFLIFAVILGTGQVFTVSASDYQSQQSILALLGELNIMRGDPDGNLRLGDYVSRAEFTKVAVAASVYKDSVASGLAISPFRDVKYDYWAAPYIKTATASGVCTGYPDGTFKPEDTVLYEEAITMFLKLLGYTDADFGISWPYGQVGIAQRAGLTDGIISGIGSALTRQDVSLLCYNLLNTEPKGGKDDYILSLGYALADDVTLIASSNEDTSVGSGKVLTSLGLSDVSDSFDYSNVGKKGTVLVKDMDKIVGFVPNKQEIKQYAVQQVLGNDIIVMENGQIKKLDIENNLTLYNKSQKTTLDAMKPQIKTGDIITTYSNKNNVLDYGTIKTDELKGPFTVKSDNWVSTVGLSDPVVIRNGQKALGQDIKVNDIAYYSTALNTVWSYSNTKTGVYERAIPNKDMPTSVVVSGETYEIEGVEAYDKLSSGGSLDYGDTVTVLLGKTNQIADVLTENLNDKIVYGYLYGTGSKEMTRSDNTKYTSYYARIATPDGNSYEYAAKQDYEDSVNSIVKLMFTDGVAAVYRQSTGANVSGNFSWDSKRLGSDKIADDVDIIDVTSLNNDEMGKYVSVFPQRLDGVSLSSRNVIYAEKNENGGIKSLILYDVTGDAYDYGMITSANGKSGVNKYGSIFATGTYTYDIGGVSKTFTSSSAVYSVSSGIPVKITFNALGAVDKMTNLIRVDGSISDVTNTYINTDSGKYALSDKVVVYLKDYNNDYTILPLSDIVNSDKYDLSAYIDKSIDSGGRVRAIVAK